MSKYKVVYIGTNNIVVCTGNFCKDFTIEKLDEENIYEPKTDL